LWLQEVFMPWTRILLSISLLATLPMQWVSCAESRNDDGTIAREAFTWDGYDAIVNNPAFAASLFALIALALAVAVGSRKWSLAARAPLATLGAISISTAYLMLGMKLFLVNTHGGAELALFVLLGLFVANVAAAARASWPLLKRAWRERRVPWLPLVLGLGWLPLCYGAEAVGVSDDLLLFGFPLAVGGFVIAGQLKMLGDELAEVPASTLLHRAALVAALVGPLAFSASALLAR
jgi:hypothetical protein